MVDVGENLEAQRMQQLYETRAEATILVESIEDRAVGSNRSSSGRGSERGGEVAIGGTEERYGVKWCVCVSIILVADVTL